MLRRITLFLFLLFASSIVFAQDEAITITAYRVAYVYEGPGITYPQIDALRVGLPVQVVERNRIGNWLRIQRIYQDEVILDGWVLTGYLNYQPDLLFSEILVSDLADAMPENIVSESLSTIYAQAIIPTLSDAMIAVYENGQTLGNRRDAITKIGDSNMVSDGFMTLFSDERTILGSYEYLEETLHFYRDSTAEVSVATDIGLTSYVVFDPMWADDERCHMNETPLACEYRLKRPSVAFIHFGHNDVRVMDEEAYNGQIRLVIEESIESGVIPVLMTFSNHEDDKLFWQGVNLNLELISLAQEYDVPLINLWSASRHLPDYGLDIDNVHLTFSGFSYLKYDTGHDAFYGVSLQNLLVLRTLHEIHETLEL